MNILLLNTCYQGGGAEKVTRQLFHGYDNDSEINMHLIVGRDDTKNPPYEVINDTQVSYFFSRAYGKVAAFRAYDKHATSRIIETIKKYNIDILHMHNIHGNYMGIQDIKEISQYCKIIWTMHDMWPLTGHCAHSFECSKWIEGNCAGCPHPETYPEIQSDVAGKMLELKKECFAGKDITFVSPSMWLKGQFDKSYLAGEKIEVIPNGINTEEYAPAVRFTLKDKYGIPQNKNVILFAASNLNSQFRSFGHLLEALEKIPNKSDYCLVVIGGSDDKITYNSEYTVFEFGYVDDEKKMNELYALSDVFITPSLADNFPCTTIESFASGTPVIAFASGGLMEQIDQTTGWLVKPGDAEALSYAIRDAFSDKNRLSQLSLNCRIKAVNKYSEKTMLDNYKALYKKVYEGR